MIPERAHRPPTAVDGNEPRRPSLGELLRELLDDARATIRDEVELAKTETKENVTAMAKGLVPIAAAAACGLAAFLLAVTVLDVTLTVLLDQAMSLRIAIWLAPLLLCLAFAAIAWGLAKKGKETIKRQRLALDKTKTTLREDKQWIKQHVS